MVNLKWKKSIKNGKLNGISNLYYENGELKSKSIYVDNKDIESRSWYENRQLEDERIGGRDEYKFKRYYENGQLEEEEILENGELLISKNYYENGQLRLMQQRAGRYFMVFKYYENGRLSSIKNYKDDDYYGIQQEYRKDGTLVTETYVNGKRNWILMRIYKEYF